MHASIRLVPTLLLFSVWLVGADEPEPLADTEQNIATYDPVPFPDMAPTIGTYLEKYYYDPSRFHPRLMVERALRALETSEVTIDTRWLNDHISVVIKETTTDIPAKEPTTLDEAMIHIEAVRKVVDTASYTKKRRRELAYTLVNGALSSLDPHTVLMSPEPAREFGDSINGEFFGIGAWLTQDEGLIAIDRVMPGLPADRGGVEDGDVILAIDGEKTAGLSLDQAVRRIKGPKGTNVTLTLERRSANRTLDLAITRDLVQVITMRSHRLGEIGYVRMDEFNANTARDLKASIDDLVKGGPLSALVLDLRFNGGGLLDQAKLVSDLFLGRGQEIVRTVTIDGEPTITKSDGRKAYQFPLAVLTSAGSASAAEILSGALQRNDRAVVFGTTSFGKGSVQTIRPLRDGSRLKLTIQEYQLPGGVSIQDVGVAPDVHLVRHSLKKDGSLDRLRPFSREREEDDEFALANSKAYAHDSAYHLGWVAAYRTKDELKQSGISAREFAPDQEAMLVLKLMAETVKTADFASEASTTLKNGTLRQFLIERLKTPVNDATVRESQTLASTLAKQTKPIIWGDDGIPGKETLSLAYTGPNEISASPLTATTNTDGEAPAELTFTVTNRGSTPIGHLYGSVQADKYSPLWEDELLFGAVAPGQTITGTLPFHVPPRVFSGEERFTLNLRSDLTDEPLASLPVIIAVRAQPRPHLSFTWQIDDPAELKPGIPAIVTVNLTNDGAGPLSAPIARVFKSDDPFVQLGDTRFDYNGSGEQAAAKVEKSAKRPNLAAGESWSVKIPVTIAQTVKGQNFTGDHITLQLSCQETFGDETSHIDSRYRAGIFDTITIPVNEKIKPRTVQAPMVTLGKLERLSGNDVALTITLTDDNPQFITVFQDDDKVDLRTVGKDSSFRFPLTLKPGMNNVRVVATDQDEVDQVLPIRLWGEGQPIEKRKVTITPTAEISTVP
jgi:carboxyl-terminal processing protease